MMGRYEELRRKSRRPAGQLTYSERHLINVLYDISETLALIYDTMTGDVDWPEDEEDLQ